MKTVQLFCFLLLASAFLSAFVPENNPDAVVGTWLNGTRRGQVLIYKQDNKYYGRIVWLSEPNGPNGKPKTDVKNGDAALRHRPVLGLDVMADFTYEGGNVWQDGKIYNPEDGKMYSCKMTLKNPNTLDVRGYMGISLLGKTQTWTRVK